MLYSKEEKNQNFQQFTMKSRAYISADSHPRNRLMDQVRRERLTQEPLVDRHEINVQKIQKKTAAFNAIL